MITRANKMELAFQMKKKIISDEILVLKFKTSTLQNCDNSQKYFMLQKFKTNQQSHYSKFKKKIIRNILGTKSKEE